MCGLAGLYDPRGWREPGAVEERLREASRALAHRGPDAEGLRVLAAEGVGLAHRRLAILDLDRRADQPMAGPDGSLVAYNGEIYNFRELREELRRAGESFATESDTEVLLAGCRVWGLEGLLRRAAGMFAFAHYDARARRLTLARDRAGKKPLYYAETPGGLAFASEMSALLALAPSARALDPDGLDAYLALKFVPSPRSLFRGVRTVRPGHLVEAAPGRRPRERRYWHPLGAAGAPRPRDWEAAMEAALDRAVARRLVSDVPVCLFLSGGIDSSLMAERLAAAGARDLRAYSIGYRDLPAYNEFSYARKVAERLPLRYEEILLDSAEARALLQDDALVLDEPISDWVWVPLYQLSRRARADGFKVVLVGEGSDEIFFGYDSMLAGLRALERYRRPLWRALAAAGARALAPVYRRARRGHRRFDLWRRVAAGEPAYLGSSVGFGRSQRHQVAGPRLRAEGSPRLAAEFIAGLYRDYAESAPDPEDAVNLVCFIEFHAKMTEVLLQRVDRVTMRHSLEARSPFLDHELVELAFALPGALKIEGGRLKAFLKRIARKRLPSEVVDRPKMGFSFPFKEWLRGALGEPVAGVFAESALFSDGWVDGEFARALLREHRRGLVDHAPRVWLLYALARWYDRWIAGARR